MFTSKNEKNNWIWWIVTGAALLGYGILTYRLFYNQCVHVDDYPVFVSDMKAYMQTAMGQESGYSFPYPIFFWCIRLFMVFLPVEAATALVTCLLNMGSVALVLYYVHVDIALWNKQRTGRQQDARGENYETWIKGLWFLLVFSIFFVSMLYAPKGIYLPGMDHKYLGVFTANPYHNATYLATRPFSIVAFYLFLRIWDHYEETIGRKEGLCFSVALLLTTMTKPSFTLVFGMAAAIVLLAGLLRSKGKNLKQTALFVLCFVPTILDLLYQFRGVFQGVSDTGEEAGMGIGLFSAWSLYCHNIPLAVVLALAFPGLYLVLNLKRLWKDKAFGFTWLLMGCAFFTLGFLYEKGERFDDLNFSWG
ncbi:MAG: hypothetical protein K6A92_00025, partial [Lachnospiraceae bacterium]|nr:hypothetical protein [Lachnospiraceae bacterium]